MCMFVGGGVYLNFHSSGEILTNKWLEINSKYNIEVRVHLRVTKFQQMLKNVFRARKPMKFAPCRPPKCARFHRDPQICLNLCVKVNELQLWA